MDKGLIVMGGLIDNDYRGEIKVLLANTTRVRQRLFQGDRIAQIVAMPKFNLIFQKIEVRGYNFVHPTTILKITLLILARRIEQDYARQPGIRIDGPRSMSVSGQIWTSHLSRLLRRTRRRR